MTRITCLVHKLEKLMFAALLQHGSDIVELAFWSTIRIIRAVAVIGPQSLLTHLGDQI